MTGLSQTLIRPQGLPIKRKKADEEYFSFYRHFFIFKLALINFKCLEYPESLLNTPRNYMVQCPRSICSRLSWHKSYIITKKTSIETVNLKHRRQASYIQKPLFLQNVIHWPEFYQQPLLFCAITVFNSELEIN